VGLADQYIYYLAPVGKIANGRWAHLVAIFSSADGQVNYLNGKLSDGNVQIGGGYEDFVRNGKSDFLIGGVGTNWPSGGAFARFKGSIDEVAVYKRALTAQEIQNHYIQALYGNDTKPIFLSQPSALTRSMGDSASLSAHVEGSLPITYQWLKNGAPVSNATNDTLSFSTAAFGDSGTYQLVAVNPVGTNSSVSVALTVLPPVTFANATNALVLHLKFDGSYADSSGRGNNGTAVGAPTFVAGQVGQALHYSTTTDNGGSGGNVTNANYVSLGRPSDLLFGSNTSFSVAFWVKLPRGYLGGDLPFFGSAVNSANSHGFTFCPSYTFGGWQWSLVEITTGGVTNNVDVNGPDNSINDGDWHHFAATFDRAGAAALTYLDGDQVSSNSIAIIGSFDTTNTVSIGQDPTGLYTESGSADLDDLGVWHRVLTPAEVYEIYYSGLHFGNSLDQYGPVSVAVTTSGKNVLVIWQAGTLMQADTANGTWTPVPGATPPSYTVLPGAGAKFYRVHL
jgi:hypothetical protein